MSCFFFGQIMMTKLYQTLRLLLIAASLALAGCTNVEEPAEARAENSVPEGDQATEVQEPELPKVDYWKPLAGDLAGDYSTQCMRMTAGDPERFKATVTLAADGGYKFNEHVGSLLTGSMMAINRSREDDGSVRLVFTGGEDGTGFSLATGVAGKGSMVSLVKRGGDTNACEPGKQAIGLAAKPLHVVYASFLTLPSQKIGCILPGDITKTAVNLALKNGVLKIGKYTYELAKADEMVMLDKGTLMYTATINENHMASVALDEFGKIAVLTSRFKDEPMVMCTHKD